MQSRTERSALVLLPFVAVCIVAAFLEAGFSTDHFELIQNSIGQARATRRRRTA